MIKYPRFILRKKKFPLKFPPIRKIPIKHWVKQKIINTQLMTLIIGDHKLVALPLTFHSKYVLCREGKIKNYKEKLPLPPDKDENNTYLYKA